MDNRGNCYQQGSILYKLGRYEQALELFSLARIQSPQDSSPVAMCAWCHHCLADYSRGIEVAKEAIAINPNNANAYNALGSCYMMRASYRKALEALERSKLINAENAHTHFLMCIYFSFHSDPKNALACIDEALRLDPEDASYLTRRSKLLLELGRTSESMAVNDLALRLAPESADAHIQLGILQRGDGEVEESMRSLREALRQNPNDHEAKLQLYESARNTSPYYRLFAKGEKIIEKLPSFVAPSLSFGYLALDGAARLHPTKIWLNVLQVTVGWLLFVFFTVVLLFPILIDVFSRRNSDLNASLSSDQRKRAVRILILSGLGITFFLLGRGTGILIFTIVGLLIGVTAILRAIIYRFVVT